jgi:hypothetical protein
MVRQLLITVVAAAVLTLAAGTESIAQKANPCAAKNPCATKNPCAAKNPCGAKAAGSVKDATAAATAKAYKGWKKVNDQPVLSPSHGNRLVFTYLNKRAEGAGLSGKFPFAEGAVLAKESFENEGGKPGARAPLFIMEKRKKGYDPGHNDWHYVTVNPDGTVAMSGTGKDGSPTQFCAACHSVAKVNDYVFGNGTIMKVKPTAMSAPATNPCAVKNPCAPKK